MKNFPSFVIKSARVVHKEAAIERPVVTSFGQMTARHAVFLRLESDSSHVGLGESWVNFPIWAPWERIALFEKALIPYLQTHREVKDIPTYIAALFEAFAGQARQSGTIASLIQGICAVEGALWDVAAREADMPLCQLLFDQPQQRVQVYGSGINAPLPFERIDAYLEKGVTLFKLKIGFGDDADKANLKALIKHLNGQAEVMVDVNRKWGFQQALGWLPILADHGVVWLEEPLTYEDELWIGELQVAKQVPIAGGENVITPPGSSIPHLLNFPFDYWQPDVTKYTPLHVALALNSGADESGQVDVVPHFLGSGPGLALSLQLAAGCQRGLIELDINPNPLRTELCSEPFEIVDGAIEISDRPGIGWTVP
ncbi:MAG: mandelate racemase/muconate lactonizing enzyme family protein [Chloroflexota bacterium]